MMKQGRFDYTAVAVDGGFVIEMSKYDFDGGLDDIDTTGDVFETAQELVEKLRSFVESRFAFFTEGKDNDVVPPSFYNRMDAEEAETKANIPMSELDRLLGKTSMEFTEQDEQEYYEEMAQ